MEIVGIGTEIVECGRIARLVQEHGEMFLGRLFTPPEIRYCQARRHVTEHFAERWAAKEAILKALAAPWRQGASWTEVEIQTSADGQARVELTGAVREHADAARVADILLALAHCRAYATAYALALRRPPPHA